MTLLDVAQSYGTILRRAGREYMGPCPACGGHDRFAINTTKQVWNCRHCSVGGDAIDLIRHVEGVGYRAALERLTGEKPVPARPPQRPPSTTDDPDDHGREQQRKAAWLWKSRQPIIGSIVERYLREARGYPGPIPATLGFLPARKPDHHPAMIAAFGIPDEPEPGVVGVPSGVEAIHLTLLKPDGSGKAAIERNKLCVGSPSGRPIGLAPPNDLLGLAITEGIEDALSVHAAIGLGAWAAGAAGFMPALAAAVPRFIESVTIYAHDDDGRRHALALADALVARGVEVLIEGLW